MKKFMFVERTSPIDINEMDVKYYIKSWLKKYPYDMQIHDVTVKTIVLDNGGSYIKVTFYLGRPGLLIGKGGRTINELTEGLTKHLKQPVKVLIVKYDWGF